MYLTAELCQIPGFKKQQQQKTTNSQMAVAGSSSTTNKYMSHQKKNFVDKYCRSVLTNLSIYMHQQHVVILLTHFKDFKHPLLDQEQQQQQQQQHNQGNSKHKNKPRLLQRPWKYFLSM